MPRTGGALDGGDERAGAFVVAQGVHTDPGAAGGLGDAQARLGAGASGPGYRPRLEVISAGKWLAAMTIQEMAYVDPERAFADLMWDERFGDRHTAMTVLMCAADAGDIHGALAGALLTDDEMLAPDEWIDYPDPFGD
jgi:hypothetical protein